tara:strand:+ start:216 stop:692 length:477 start_codon:yes stop_codon:yes gene_type:complete
MELFIDKLRKELEDDEGCIYETYLDHLGYPTFGIGHLVTQHDPEYGEPVGTRISSERISECFEQDIMVTINDCKKIYDDWQHLPEEVRLICANMMFNLGYPRYSKFRKCIQAVKDGMWSDAAREMESSRWHKQVTNRANRLIERMKNVKMLQPVTTPK